MENTFDALVVDDERGMREGCRRILARHARFVDTADSGEEALAKIKDKRFDLALIDIKMPGMSGLELLDHLREVDPDVISIVLTGYATFDTAIQATKKGAYDFLPKPFSPDELMAKVFSALERRQLTQEARRLREERERRLLEIATEKSRLRTIINCIQDGVLVTNREANLVLYNPAALRLLDLTGDCLLRQCLLECIPYPELVDLILTVLDDESGHAMVAQEVPIPEQQQILMANVAAVLDEGGEKLGAVVVLRDITEMKTLDRSKSQFVSMVSHELRAPLAAIEGYLGLILSGTVADSPEEELQMLTRSRERAKALLDLIDDLLDISRIEAGQVAKVVDRIDVCEVVRETARLLGPQAVAKRVVIHDELPSALPEVDANYEDIVRVFTNLVSNAIKYNREGGEIWLGAREDGPYVRVDVADSGLGMAAESIPRVFDEFYRVKRPETREIAGTGLGLTIARKIVESYNGSISVESELGKGSTFSVFLPRRGVAIAESCAKIASQTGT